MVREITPTQFDAGRRAGSNAVLLDVREDWELEIASVPGTVHIPMSQVPARLAELDAEREIVVLCRSGGRSLQVAQFLERNGFASVANLRGGILAWSRELDATIAEY
jgi:rhodanese-related sulfurtransferase